MLETPKEGQSFKVGPVAPISSPASAKAAHHGKRINKDIRARPRLYNSYLTNTLSANATGSPRISG
ncbi:MAG: hypothetical protein FWF17_05525 [Betaproteobacteria bacterium]|nr:hypothetical protein [Betaproteobacteria bacterium]